MLLVDKITKPVIRCILVLYVLTALSCSPARHISKDNYLLSRNKLETTQKTISEDQLRSYIIQRPNKKLMGTRFYLFIYNLSNQKKQKWPHGWLRKIGEEPVIYDPELTKNSSDQLRQFLENKGYYHAEVYDTVAFKRRNAIVTYDIKFNKPYRVQNIAYNFKDTGLISKILPDTVNSFLTRGMRFDKDVLQQERERIETLLKENGYFKFSKEYIFYDAVTQPENYSVDLTMHIQEYSEGTPDTHTKIKYHPKYRIGNVFVFPNYSDIGNLDADGKVSGIYDTILFRDLYFLNKGKPNLKPNPIVNRNYIIPGEFYKLSNVNLTYRNLSALSIVRFTNVTFNDSDSVPRSGNYRYLDAKIELTQKKLQSFQADLAGTNSSGDLGIRGNLLYSNFNLFRGAEVFSTQLTGAIESLENQTNGKYNSMKELGAQTNVLFPKFFTPFRLERFVKKYAPKTSISISFNYQSRPDYTRSIANSSLSYRWNGNDFITHSVWPLELNYVKVYEDISDKRFLDSIENTPLGYSFKDHVINVARYTFELNNQAIGKSRNFVFTRFNVESAGNLLNLMNTAFSPKNEPYTYKLLGVPYFQYFLGDVDLRYYNIIDKQNRFVYRLFVGVGYPFGNFKTLPYEKKYFSGGPNSIRAWNTRDLGPGSYVDTDTSATALSYFLNKNGDIKLEANIEYRFKLVWKIEAALFLDAGNVWDIRKDVDKPNAEFNWNRFHKEIAVGTGFGARLDFSFFLLRIDVGIKLRDPAIQDTGDRWIPVFREFGMNDLHWKFGIGYPF